MTVVQLDADAPGQVRLTVVGHDLAAGQQLQHVVPPNTWFGAVPGDATQQEGAAQWALVGCTVAPGEQGVARLGPGGCNWAAHSSGVPRACPESLF